MKVLITGATGFVGKVLCAELISQGHEIRAAVRTKVAPIKNVEMTMVGEVDRGTDWSTRDVDSVDYLSNR